MRLLPHSPEPLIIASLSDGMKKIGEASYSEVFAVKKFRKHRNIVMKIIPFDGTELVNNTDQLRLDDLLREVRVTSAVGSLSLRGFNFVEFVGYS